MSNLLKGFLTHAPIDLNITPNPFKGMPSKRFLITGATGFIGSLITSQLIDADHYVRVLTRSIPHAAKVFQALQSNKLTFLTTLSDLSVDEKIDVVINLAGKPIIGFPWTAQQKHKLIKSRINTTNDLMAWYERTMHKPELFIQTSAIGYYGPRDPHEILTEESTMGEGFMAELCHLWEKSVEPIDQQVTRLITFRFGVIYGQGGALPKLALPFYFALGGKLGNGKQMISWAHRLDVSRAFAYALDNSSLKGVYNLVTPNPISQECFSKTLARFIKRPHSLPLPKRILKTLLGEMSDVFIEGQQVSSKKLEQAGFTFSYPQLISALNATIKIC